MGKSIIAILAVAAGLSLVGCDEDSGGGVGSVCSSDADCGGGLTCNTSYFDGQCSAWCNFSQECKESFGEYTFCIGAHYCVAECARTEDCPPRTACNSYGWCQR